MADTTWIKTHCSRMDHGGCAIRAGVQNGRIVDLRANPDGYLNQGYICAKALAAARKLEHPKRLRQPLKRKGARGRGQWETIAWDEALDIICEQLETARQRHGAASVAFCQGMPKGFEHFALIRLANTFGSPNVVGVQDVCHAPREISGLHTCGFYPVTDFHHDTRQIVLWGSNITATNEEGQICSLLTRQLKKGARLIIIDPRRMALTEKSHIWLQLNPGSDLALALAFLNVIIDEKLYDTDFVAHWTHGFEDLASHVAQFTPDALALHTGIAAGKIRETARAMAELQPTALHWGNAIEHTSHNFDVCRALIGLMALCGNLDVTGGNIQALEPAVLSPGRFVKAELLRDKHQKMIHAAFGAIPRLMTVPPVYFRRAVLEQIPYPVTAAYLQGTNPLLTHADSRETLRTLNKLDFLAVSDIFMTPTAAQADLVLPAATHLEFDDIGHYGLGQGVILARPQVVQPPDHCWPDIKILNALGRRLCSEHWFDDHRKLLDLVLAPAGLTYRQFVEKGMLTGPVRFQKYLEKGFKTPSGKVELRLSQAEQFGLPALPQYDTKNHARDMDYPLLLTSAKSRYYLNSSYRWLEPLQKREPMPRAQIHPETAALYGIIDGDRICIETRSGDIMQTASLTRQVLPGVVYAAYGWWFCDQAPEDPRTWQTANYNMLTSGQNVGKAFGTPQLRAIPCRVCRVKS